LPHLVSLELDDEYASELDEEVFLELDEETFLELDEEVFLELDDLELGEISCNSPPLQICVAGS